ncbi:uncharacterized protein LOC110011773 [Sesamum indicum]|uniref:Uncharacterized protein LOC110011773 n=1 Tax=Sesamum indicum TaxID=4182 RepID=A0A8M8UXF3_SESIN|nr:uncharacterized protein LOC110011773 [Sesamum indicum]
MPSSSSSNSESRSGSKPRSSSGSSSSRSESASGSSPESGSGSSLGSGSRSVSRSSHGSYSTSPKRNKKFPVTKLKDEQAGPSVLAKLTDWAFGPYQVPGSARQKPLGGCGLDPSFDNFWSLYSFTTSKRSGSRGFFYLSAKPDCGYLSALKSNNEWTKYKPLPKTCGGGLEGDQIRSLTFYKYDPKKLLNEKVLQLSGLSPASLHIEESLGDFLLSVSLAFIAVVFAYANLSLLADSIIMSTRTAMRRIAAQNKSRKGGEIASSSDPKGKGKAVASAQDLSLIPPPSVPSKTLAIATPDGQQPIAVDSEGTPSAHNDHLGYNSSELELGLDEASGGHGVDQGSPGPPEERSKKRRRSPPKKGQGPKSKLGPSDKGKGKEPAEASHPPSKSHSPSVLSRMAKEAADKTSVDEDRDKFLRVAQLATCWEDSRASLRGNVPPPEWQDMSSSSLYGEAGGDTFAIYNSFVSVRDQGALVPNNPIRLEEFAAHSLVQAMTFLRSLSLKCTHYQELYSN